MAVDDVLRRDLKQTRPFRTDAEAVMVDVLLTADRLRRRMSALVEPRGITVQQFNVLRILRGAGADGVPTLEVGARMIEQTPGITRLLDRLETKHLVRRQRCPHDRRQHLCWITAEGDRLLAELDAATEQVAEEAVKGISHPKRAELLKLLDQIRQKGTGVV